MFPFLVSLFFTPNGLVERQIPLAYIDPLELGAKLQGLLNTEYRVSDDTLFVLAHPKTHQKIRELLMPPIETGPPFVAVLPIVHGDAKMLLKQLSSGAKLLADEPTNSLLVICDTKAQLQISLRALKAEIAHRQAGSGSPNRASPALPARW